MTASPSLLRTRGGLLAGSGRLCHRLVGATVSGTTSYKAACAKARRILWAAPDAAALTTNPKRFALTPRVYQRRHDPRNL